jgi:hypothetical protein
MTATNFNSNIILYFEVEEKKEKKMRVEEGSRDERKSMSIKF